MKLLAIDTVTEYCSVALYLDGELMAKEILANQSHTEVVLPMVENLLAEGGTYLRQLDVIAFDRGPGSFTGLRIGAGVVQGLALGADLPLIPVSSLHILAQGCHRQHHKKRVLSAIDARQGEIYWGCFHDSSGLMTLNLEEQISFPDMLITPNDDSYFGAGSGFDTYECELRDNSRVNLSGYDKTCYPLAQDMIPFAKRAWERQEHVDAGAALPVYLRDKVATPPTR